MDGWAKKKLGMMQGLGDTVSSKGLDAMQIASMVSSLPAPQKKALAFLMRNGPTVPAQVGEGTGMGDEAAGAAISVLTKVGVVSLQNGYAIVPEALQKILARTSILRGYGY